MEVVTKSGARYKERVLYQKGHYKDPMTDKELEAKFRSLAEGLLSGHQMRRLLDQLWNLEQIDDIGEVMGVLKV